jgi:CBS domain-containing protein
MQSKISVRDAMVTNVITISKNASVVYAAKVMLEHNIGGLVVVEEKEPIGIITEKDFTKVLSRNEDPSSLKVEDTMSKELITISPNTSILDAAKLMTTKGIRKLPVKEDGKLVGILTAEDIVRVAPKEIELLLELATIKSQDSSEFLQSSTEGICEVCGNYSDYLYLVGDVYMCPECKASREE